MDGYTRSPEMTKELLVALADALCDNPTQRLGQLLINVATASTIDICDTGHIWDVHDEDWVRLLRKYI
jgi:hypothetical protein